MTIEKKILSDGYIEFHKGFPNIKIIDAKNYSIFLRM